MFIAHLNKFAGVTRRLRLTLCAISWSCESNARPIRLFSLLPRLHYPQCPRPPPIPISFHRLSYQSICIHSFGALFLPSSSPLFMIVILGSSDSIILKSSGVTACFVALGVPLSLLHDRRHVR
ncbi:hypothetical protein BGW80DRAFT_1364197, partial [Lactifluus volemus]